MLALALPKKKPDRVKTQTCATALLLLSFFFGPSTSWSTSCYYHVTNCNWLCGGRLTHSLHFMSFSNLVTTLWDLKSVIAVSWELSGWGRVWEHAGDHSWSISMWRLAQQRVWTKGEVGHGLGHGVGHGLPYGLPYGPPYGLPVVNFF